MEKYVVSLAASGKDDVGRVGGKNASLGEMIGHMDKLGIRVPGGFATTADAFSEFLSQDGLDETIHRLLDDLDVDDIGALTGTGAEIRRMIMNAPLPSKLRDAVTAAWRQVGSGEDIGVAVRSSATAEDLPEASFAGQQDTLLNVRGLDNVIAAIHRIYASLFNDRAIAYRVHRRFDHRQVSLSVGVQRMVRADLASSGVMFTLDTESGFRHLVLISSSYGLGETIVQGAVNPDEFYVYKPTLASGHHAIVRRNLGAKAVKMVYADRGDDRVATVDVGAGTARVVSSVEEMNLIQPGDVLVADMTDPDWEPVMKRASAIVTNRGGRTCHAAIIARELGIPAVVGCGSATKDIPDGTDVTVSCAEGDEGFVYKGRLDYEEQEVRLEKLPDIPIKLAMNVGNPDRAFAFASIPNHGVGLARLEFIINRMIGVHPKALMEFEQQEPGVRELIEEHMAGYGDPVSFYVEKLSEGIGCIAAAFAPKPVIVRLSDFKSNEYANLIGGSRYEPLEENPMLGFRGAARYVDEEFKPCFELECRALRRVRNRMGLKNVQVMVPFVRTLTEARQVVELLAENGLVRGEDGLELIMMCELPGNALLADRYLEFFDGMSIGSNDMTQLTLGLDRDSGKIASLFDERDEAVKLLLDMAITACRERGKYVGICGQGPSDHPDLALWLLDRGIDSLSLNPDSVLDTWLYLAEQSNRTLTA